AGTSGGGSTSFTRAGSFTVDANGNLKNVAGLFPQGQKLTPAQSQQIAQGNINVFSATSPDSLQTVNVHGIAGSATATANVSLAANLPATDTAASTPRSMTVPVFDSQG